MTYVIGAVATFLLVLLFRLSIPSFKVGDKKTSIWGRSENAFPSAPYVEDSSEFVNNATLISDDPVDVADMVNMYQDADKYFDYYRKNCRYVVETNHGVLPILAAIDAGLIICTFSNYWSTVGRVIWVVELILAIVIISKIFPHAEIPELNEKRVRCYDARSKKDVEDIYNIAVSYAWAAKYVEKVVSTAKGFQLALVIYSGILIAAFIFVR